MASGVSRKVRYFTGHSVVRLTNETLKAVLWEHNIKN